MQILVIGSGGREHALAWKAAQDNTVSKVYVCPGNAGTAIENKLENISLDVNDFEIIENFCKKEDIKLVIIGPEQPLVMGMADYLQSKGVKTFGPSQAARVAVFLIYQLVAHKNDRHAAKKYIQVASVSAC